MKREALRHPKLDELVEAWKVDRPTAIGLLTLLFDFVADYTPRGDVGKFSNHAIATKSEWKGDPDDFISALVDGGWVDADPEHRLVMHDWHEHCPNWVRAKLKKAGRWFVTGLKTDLKSGLQSLLPTKPNQTKPNDRRCAPGGATEIGGVGPADGGGGGLAANAAGDVAAADEGGGGSFLEWGKTCDPVQLLNDLCAELNVRTTQQADACWRAACLKSAGVLADSCIPGTLAAIADVRPRSLARFIYGAIRKRSGMDPDRFDFCWARCPPLPPKKKSTPPPSENPTAADRATANGRQEGAA